MSDGFIRAQLRRANRNLLIVNLLLAGGAAAIFGAFQKDLLGVALGPAPLDTEALFKAAKAENVAQSYVTFKPEVVSDPVLKKTITSKNSTSVKSYRLAPLGSRLLVVETWQDHAGKEFTGFLVPVPSEVAGRLGVHTIKQPLFPVMLDAATGTFGSWFAIVALAVPFLLGTWNVFSGLSRLGKPDRHPVAARLRAAGGEVIAEIDAEVADAAGVTTLRNVTVTRNWLLRRSMFGLTVVRLDQLAWIYQKVVSHSTNGVPTGKTYSAQLRDRGGGSVEISGKKDVVERTLGEIAVRVPWVLVGYSDELEKDWKSKRADVLAVLDERKRLVEQARAEQASGRKPEPTTPAGT